MSHFFIRSVGQALALRHAYNHCSNCSDCALHVPYTSYRCGYLYDCAERYISAHPDQVVAYLAQYPDDGLVYDLGIMSCV